MRRAAAVLVAVLVLAAVLAPLLWSDRASTPHPEAILHGPSGQFPLGTDLLGRDILARILVATRLSLLLALAATAIGVVGGLALGAAPAVAPRIVARLLSAVINVGVAFPSLLLALFFAVVFGVGAKGAVLAIGCASAPGFARLTRTLAAGIAGRDFVAAARIAGVGRWRILVRHIVPNIAEPLVVTATMQAGNALLAFAGLSFLGLGVQAPSYDWGRLLGEGLAQIYIHPAGALAAGGAVVVAAMAFNLSGEALARALSSPAPRASGEDRPTADADAVTGDALLVAENLKVKFPQSVPVRGITLTVASGEAVGIVGESGSGKTLTALALARLLEAPGRVEATRLELLGHSLLDGSSRGGPGPVGTSPGGPVPAGFSPGGASRRRFADRGSSRAAAERRLLGTGVAMVFQDPMTSLNPVHRVGRQLAEVARRHLGAGRREAWDRAVDRLAAVRIGDPARRARQLPHELSGGMRQRAMIGMGLMGSPRLIIADEPTTALDVTVQKQVLALLDDVRSAGDVALLFISHDVTVVRQVCSRVLVMYAGRIVEDLPSDALFTDARHPYTRALADAVPDMDSDRDRPLAVIPGRPPSGGNPPPGCAFAPRCPLVTDRCRTEEPLPVAYGNGRRVACWNAHKGER